MNKVLQKEVDIVEKARSLVSGLRERANETEKIRQIPEASMQEFKDAGLFKMLRPKRYGGQEVSMRTYSEVIVEISRGCGSSGWISCLMRHSRTYGSAIIFRKNAHTNF